MGALAFLQAEYRLLAFFVVDKYRFSRLSYFVPTTYINSSCFVFGAFGWGYSGNENSKQKANFEQNCKLSRFLGGTIATFRGYRFSGLV
jgi:hypothetical protein